MYFLPKEEEKTIPKQKAFSHVSFSDTTILQTGNEKKLLNCYLSLYIYLKNKKLIYTSTLIYPLYMFFELSSPIWSPRMISEDITTCKLPMKFKIWTSFVTDWIKVGLSFIFPFIGSHFMGSLHAVLTISGLCLLNPPKRDTKLWQVIPAKMISAKTRVYQFETTSFYQCLLHSF